MRKIELMDAIDPLSSYATEVEDGPIIVTKDGQPLFALISLENEDWESISLANNPKFLAIIERSRARQKVEGGISSEEMRRRLGLPPRQP